MENERKDTPGVNTITVVPISVMRKVFPDSDNLKQKYLLGRDLLIIHGTLDLQYALMKRAGLNGERHPDGRTCLFPDITRWILPDNTPCLRISAEARDKLRNAGLRIDSIRTVEAAKNALSPKRRDAGYALN